MLPSLWMLLGKHAKNERGKKKLFYLELDPHLHDWKASTVTWMPPALSATLVLKCRSRQQAFLPKRSSQDDNTIRQKVKF